MEKIRGKSLMLEFDKNYIPLFLEQNEANVSYIIDNKLLGSDKYGGYGHYPYRAFSLILDFYNNESTRNIIPERLQKVLDIDFNVPKFYSKDLLVGELDQLYRYGITLEMIINDDSSKPIQFTNFNYYHGIQGTPLNKTIALKLEHAFFLTANILANDRCLMFDRLVGKYPRLELDELPVSEDIYTLERWRVENYGKSYIVLTEFAFEYLKYLRDELLAERLSPSAILHFSGATTLAFLNEISPVKNYIDEVLLILKEGKRIDFNQKVLYYALIHSSLLYLLDNDEVKNFLSDYRVNSKYDYEKTILKEFPKSNNSLKF